MNLLGQGCWSVDNQGYMTNRLYLPTRKKQTPLMVSNNRLSETLLALSIEPDNTIKGRLFVIVGRDWYVGMSVRKAKPLSLLAFLDVVTSVETPKNSEQQKHSSSCIGVQTPRRKRHHLSERSVLQGYLY